MYSERNMFEKSVLCPCFIVYSHQSRNTKTHCIQSVAFKTVSPKKGHLLVFSHTLLRSQIYFVAFRCVKG